MLPKFKTRTIKARWAGESIHDAPFFKRKTRNDGWRAFKYYRQQWRRVINSDAAKSTITTKSYTIKTSNGGRELVEYRYRKPGCTRGAHFLLHNIITGRRLDKGFTPVTNQRKLENGLHAYHGFTEAINDLLQLIESAKKFQAKPVKNWVDFRELERVNSFLSAISHTVTFEDLAGLDTTRLKTIKF